MQTNFDIETLRSALARPDEALAEREAQPGSGFIRASVALRFTIAFETTVSVFGCYLETVYLLPDARVMSPRRHLQEAADLGLIAECADWLRHAENRNRPVHAHREPLADAIAANADAFAADARALLVAMERAIDLPEAHRKQALEIIRARVPDATVWVYGSRAKGAPAATPTSTSCSTINARRYPVLCWATSTRTLMNPTCPSS